MDGVIVHVFGVAKLRNLTLATYANLRWRQAHKGRIETS